MKNFACLLMLCCSAASSAAGGDSREVNRDRHVICSQFVIEDPDPTMARDATRYCCRVANRIRDCLIGDWDEIYR
jgi:hypothetical protein